MIISRVHKGTSLSLCTLNVSPGYFCKKVSLGSFLSFHFIYKMKAAKLFVRRKKK